MHFQSVEVKPGLSILLALRERMWFMAREARFGNDVFAREKAY